MDKISFFVFNNFETPEAATGGVSVKKVFLKVLQYSQKNTCVESLFNNVASLKTCNFIKKRLQHKCFPVNSATFLRTPILKKICELVLLKPLQDDASFFITFSS